MGQLCPGNRKSLDNENNDLFEPSSFKMKYHLKEDDNLIEDTDISSLIKAQHQNMGRETGRLFIGIDEAKILEGNCNFTFDRSFFASANLIGHPKQSQSTNTVNGSLMPVFDKTVYNPYITHQRSCNSESSKIKSLS